MERSHAVIRLDPHIWTKCQAFATSVIGSNLDKYESRGQENFYLIKEQISQGKLAEFALAYFFDVLGIPCSPPDCRIYSTRNKSFDSDLVLDNATRLHVKSITKQSAERFGLSWIFQKEDPLVMEPEPMDWVALTTIVSPTTVKYYGSIAAENIEYAELKKAILRKTKCAIYFDSLDKEHLNLLPC